MNFQFELSHCYWLTLKDIDINTLTGVNYHDIITLIQKKQPPHMLGIAEAVLSAAHCGATNLGIILYHNENYLSNYADSFVIT